MFFVPSSINTFQHSPKRFSLLIHRTLLERNRFRLTRWGVNPLFSKFSSGTLVLTRAGRNDEEFCSAQDKSRGSKRNINYTSTE